MIITNNKKDNLNWLDAELILIKFCFIKINKMDFDENDLLVTVLYQNQI
jgi:hypothetical protein